MVAGDEGHHRENDDWACQAKGNWRSAS